ncbi:MAG: hypothetical protein ACRDNF_13825, partial [Streptosporangiaceae bacterium]
GKPAKVTLVAVMRKLIVVLNARMRDARKAAAPEAVSNFVSWAIRLPGTGEGVMYGNARV